MFTSCFRGDDRTHSGSDVQGFSSQFKFQQPLNSSHVTMRHRGPHVVPTFTSTCTFHEHIQAVFHRQVPKNGTVTCTKWSHCDSIENPLLFFCILLSVIFTSASHVHVHVAVCFQTWPPRTLSNSVPATNLHFFFFCSC